jgi:hypothetical protein
LLPSVLSGLADHPIEDVKFSDIFLHHVGGAPAEMARLQPPENELGYPEATMFGDLPATGFFMRHIRGVEMSNIEIQVAKPDPRPALWLEDVAGADFFRVRTPPGPAFALRQVADFRAFGSPGRPDRSIARAERETI